jgi:type I restriction enzyme S subunit
VEESTRELNRVIVTADHEISLIREYRTRLIADVVTGKLDVREAASRLPEEADEEPLDDMLLDDEEISEEAELDTEPEEVEA